MKKTTLALIICSSSLMGCTGDNQPTVAEMEKAVEQMMINNYVMASMIKKPKLKLEETVSEFVNHGCKETKKPDVFKCNVEFKYTDASGRNEKMQRGDLHFGINQKGEWTVFR